MDPDEIEFIGEKSNISIIPNFQLEAIHLISGEFGPFRPGIPVYVPLWFAIHIRKQQKCRIVPPFWMDVVLLEEKKEEERQTRYFTRMPSEHYMVEAKLILSLAPEDIPQSQVIRTIIKDIWDMRTAKLRTAMDSIVKGEDDHAKLDNLTMIEINTIRPLLPHILDIIDRLKEVTNLFYLNICRVLRFSIISSFSLQEKTHQKC